MPYCIEKYREQTGADEPVEIVRTFAIVGIQDDEQAAAFVFTQAADEYRGLKIAGNDIRVQQVGFNAFEITVPYRPAPSQDVGTPGGGSGQGGSVFGFIDVDISEETQHVTQCIEQVEYGPTAAPEIRTSRIVGLTRDGVEGVDIDASKCTFDVHQEYEPNEVDGARLKKWKKARGKTNSVPYTIGTAHYEAGELRLLRVKASSVGLEKWKVVFTFSYSENVSALKITDDITVPTKKGHEYLWV